MITRRHTSIFSFILIAFLGGTILTACSDDDDISPSTVDTKAWTIGENMDTSYKPGDNFYMYCNGSYWNNTELGENYIKGFFYTETDEINDKRIAQIDDASIKKIDNDFVTFDSDSLAALSTLQANLANVDTITTRDEAITAIAEAISNGYELPIGLDLSIKKGKILATIQVLDLSNYKDSTANLLRAVGYSAKDANDIAQSYRSAIKKLKAGGVAKAVNFKTINEDPKTSEQLVPMESLKTRSTTGYSTIDKIIELLGISSDDVSLNDSQISNYEQLETLTAEEIKGMLTVCLMYDLIYVSNDGIKQVNMATGSELTWDSIYSNVQSNYMSYIVSHAYAAQNVTEEMKNRGIATCKELQAALCERIKTLDWMSETTKEKAITKVNNMVLNVGYPDQWIEEALPTLNGNSLYDDVITLRKAKFNLCKYMIGKDRTEVSFNCICGLMSGADLTITNAFYMPVFNSINIYPTFLLEPLYREDISEAFNYAIYGAIGHEMTHGLDSNGALYDEVGDYKNWWTVDDKMTFTERLQTLVTCYDNLELMPDELPNVFANGSKTLGENVADLGGVLVAHDAYVKKLTNEGYYGEELAKQEKKFFQGWAELWRAKYSAAYAMYIKQNDAHSLCKERINGVMMNIDRWYELYDVQWGDNLYLSPERRSYIW